ncbi:chromate transporter [Rhodobacter veldkampii DSM 11550]|uniref:Chromate transporter n=1 Tax=Phaeovulum veldkampii DSM 11550 TaxID=1185920 RepID=A0A2T4JKN7_9RHOB|nr:chromate efflux transporter [Phaeovulum veldkampii]MBK5945845.1 chromate transporter [Phaeovulum veldkampii DSM 11550]PTE18433.1 chromate transporter [Phaeovulum veldkampii DSM 11550]TDQ59312.1 chromate transporter [Phaeovulum veldkampii DSM 11550]
MTAAAPRASAAQVFAAFLRLGLTAFGGPVAHLGYFRTEFVTRRGWIDDAGFAGLMALSQFLPGPASSQLGFALGWHRAGPWGAVAAFAGFTLPSAALMLALALGAPHLGPGATAALAGLKIVAVAVVAQAVLGMARSLAPDRARAGIALLAGAAVLAAGAAGAGALAQVAVIAAAGWVGALALPARTGPQSTLPHGPTRRSGLWALATLGALLVALPALAPLAPLLALTDAVARAGALVFGGGHVVLPLLEAGVVAPGWVSAPEFLAGYGAAQALPGPLFAFAAYLGALAAGPVGALLALAAIFLPGFLILIGVWPFWAQLGLRPRARAAVAGANAAVAGVLGAALVNPVIPAALHGPGDAVLALGLFAGLVWGRLPPLAAVAIGAGAGLLRGL